MEIFFYNVFTKVHFFTKYFDLTSYKMYAEEATQQRALITQRVDFESLNE